jgi:hypothetical protein
VGRNREWAADYISGSRATGVVLVVVVVVVIIINSVDRSDGAVFGRQINAHFGSMYSSYGKREGEEIPTILLC